VRPRFTFIYFVIHSLVSLTKTDGTLGTFRQADDIFEEAVALLRKRVPKDKDPSMKVSGKDIHLFSSFPYVRKALTRLCDVKGII